jgi:hypothetical protein
LTVPPTPAHHPAMSLRWLERFGRVVALVLVLAVILVVVSMVQIR